MNIKKIWSPKERKIIVLNVLQNKESISSVSKKYGVARKTIYKWIKDYDNTPKNIKEKAFENKYVSGINHPRAVGYRYKAKAIKEIARNHKLSATDLSKNLNVGRHTMVNLLVDLSLSKEEDRKTFSQSYQTSGRLKLDVKKEIIQQILSEKYSVSEVSHQYNIARKTIYQWINRYHNEGRITENYVSSKDHPRAFSKDQEELILERVINNPELSIHSLAKSIPYSSHGIYNVLQKYNLTYKNQRLAYSTSRKAQVVEAPKPAATWTDRVRLVWEQFIPSRAPAPPPATIAVEESYPGVGDVLKNFFASLTITTIVAFGSLSWFRIVSNATSTSNAIGMTFAAIALAMGSFFFAYSLKYYITLAIVLSFSQGEAGVGIKTSSGNGRKKGFLNWLLGLTNDNGQGKTGPVGLEPNLEHVRLDRYPFISVQIPFYNEKNVVERSITAATNFDYKGEYEVILCDDSTDETTEIIRDYQKKYLAKGEKLKTITNKEQGWELTSIEVKPGVTLKHLHRTSRSGFKGGALKIALTLVNPKTEFISVFDADFVPYPDTLYLFIKYFKAQNNMSEEYTKSNVAAVCGYQWHVLNKSENWITRGVRTEYAGSYVIERSAQEILGGMKLIHGSVYAIRRDALEQVGWDTSITEDFELTLKLYNAGYKVVYTPYIQAPAECVSTIKRLIRQRMRWAEGHSYNTKRMFLPLITNKNLTFMEKLEFLYLSPYYLQAFFFLVGTTSWLISEVVFSTGLPFWTNLWGWSLVFTNMLSLPLMNSVGLFIEESEQKDYLGIFSFVALSYIMVPFQAYASIKGFLERGEGPWFRTPKSGLITDIFKRGSFYRFISGILPGKQPVVAREIATPSYLANMNSYLAINTANNQFNSFRVESRKSKWIGKAVLSLLLAFTITVYSATKGVPEVLAIDPNDTQYLTNNTSGVITGVTAWQLTNAQDDGEGSIYIDIDRNEAIDTNLQFEPGNDSSVAETKCSTTPDGRGFILDTVFEGGTIVQGAWTFYIEESDTGPNRAGHIDICVYRTTISGGAIGTANLLFQSQGDTTWSTADTMNGSADSITQTTDSQCSGGCSIGPNEYLYVEYWYHNTTKVNETEVDCIIYSRTAGGSNSYITTQGLEIPENVAILIASSPLVSLVVLWLKGKKSK